MIPAKRILMTLRIADCGLRIPATPIHNQSASRDPQSAMSSFRRFHELIDALGLVERLSDRQARAHAAVQPTALKQLFVSALRGNLAAVEDQDAVGVAD